MSAGEWHSTEDVLEFLAHAGDFLRSRPAMHNTPLTSVEKLRLSGRPGRLGWLVEDGEVRAAYLHGPATHRVNLTPLTPDQAGSVADHLAGREVVAVTADHDTSTAFAEAWQRKTGAAAEPTVRIRLYRLGTLTPPDPFPEGRGRVLQPTDHEDLVRWCGEFLDAVGEAPAPTWAESRFADKTFTFWETPDGTPVSIAGNTPMVAGMVRVDPVYTPAHLRGRGYAAAATVEVSRAALAAGATDVVLYANPFNPTSNALYQRLGYVPISEFTVYAFTAPETRATA
ncbi:GNAT family N-acetyltransferase [Kutzneria sp. 744]|uniref:GNAT family N-acetyltransferase n=1 Tax=Kutzneria sp. (strain 744) TaxID=345341 RepID=UPI0003EECFDC|nr:N-acetyltransferase [Kutzneria sp. 744]EWM09938.1 GCN5-related N-acetyltransferase [Kutzneria sp. 744]